MLFSSTTGSASFDAPSSERASARGAASNSDLPVVPRRSWSADPSPFPAASAAASTGSANSMPSGILAGALSTGAIPLVPSAEGPSVGEGMTSFEASGRSFSSNTAGSADGPEFTACPVPPLPTPTGSIPALSSPTPADSVQLEPHRSTMLDGLASTTPVIPLSFWPSVSASASCPSSGNIRGGLASPLFPRASALPLRLRTAVSCCPVPLSNATIQRRVDHSVFEKRVFLKPGDFYSNTHGNRYNLRTRAT